MMSLLISKLVWKTIISIYAQFFVFQVFFLKKKNKQEKQKQPL